MSREDRKLSGSYFIGRKHCMIVEMVEEPHQRFQQLKSETGTYSDSAVLETALALLQRFIEADAVILVDPDGEVAHEIHLDVLDPYKP